MIKRPRPESQVSWDNRLVIACPASGYSFPSQHTWNTRALSILVEEKLSLAGRFFTGLAFLIGLSRIVCGVHYPSDVISGWIFGWVWGLLGVQIWRGLYNWYNQKWV